MKRYSLPLFTVLTAAAAIAVAQPIQRGGGGGIPVVGPAGGPTGPVGPSSPPGPPGPAGGTPLHIGGGKVQALGSTLTRSDFGRLAGRATLPIPPPPPSPLAFRLSLGRIEINRGFNANLSAFGGVSVLMTPGGASLQLLRTSPTHLTIAEILYAAAHGGSLPEGGFLDVWFTPENATQRYRITCTVDAMQTYNVAVFAAYDPPTTSLRLFDGTQLAPSGTLTFDYEPVSPTPGLVGITLSSTSTNWNFSGCDGLRL